jgi:hypothetical protein
MKVALNWHSLSVIRALWTHEHLGWERHLIVHSCNDNDDRITFVINSCVYCVAVGISVTTDVFFLYGVYLEKFEVKLNNVAL